ncbi:hypothetical protein BS47DRAFT_1393547 [Hydnum rufescens UP504]|uniref:Fungal-type protein kinase domain-containing protein n=1 Tax=Hydnum rufescens UP504 TaxID=1448309 RepID=A0A9P6AWB3_9AGAM|nr:hypothetical protein BS47DRAFT_1393547 [Hydnum rufescens UP504]
MARMTITPVVNGGREETRAFEEAEANVNLILTISSPQEPRLLVAIFISLARATDVELGYDPTMIRIVVNHEEQFLIHLRKNKDEIVIHRTRRLQSRFSPTNIAGQGTRVWEADVLGPDGIAVGTCLVKDSWVDVHMEREGIRYKSFLDTMPKEEYNSALRHFLMPSPQPSRCFKIAMNLAHSQNTPTTSFTLMPLLEDFMKNLTQAHYINHVHHRLVLSEVGVPLHGLALLSDTWKAIQGASQALHVMASSGWVHRDISPTSIYLVKGVGKLGDLEFAEAFKNISDDLGSGVEPQLTVSDPRSPDLKIGSDLSPQETPYFVVTEV